MLHAGSLFSGERPCHQPDSLLIQAYNAQRSLLQRYDNLRRSPVLEMFFKGQVGARCLRLTSTARVTISASTFELAVEKALALTARTCLCSQTSRDYCHDGDYDGFEKVLGSIESDVIPQEEEYGGREMTYYRSGRILQALSGRSSRSCVSQLEHDQGIAILPASKQGKNKQQRGGQMAPLTAQTRLWLHRILTEMLQHQRQ